jgi:hypothetical protein
VAGVSGATGSVGAAATASGSASSPIRAATTLALWGAAWQAGSPADEVLQAVRAVAHRAGLRSGTASVARRAGLPGPGEASGSDLDILGLLRRGGRPSLLMPVAGDLRGLPVGGEVLVPALDAGAVVVLPDVELALVPAHGQWRAYDCSSTHPTIPARDAARLLDDAIVEATRALVSADVAVGGTAAGPPREAMAARIRDEAVDLPRGSGPVASSLLARAITLDALVVAAAVHRTAAVTSGELAAVHDALGPLAAAAREARRTAVAAAVESMLDGAQARRR